MAGWAAGRATAGARGDAWRRSLVDSADVDTALSVSCSRTGGTGGAAEAGDVAAKVTAGAVLHSDNSKVSASCTNGIMGNKGTLTETRLYGIIRNAMV